MNRSTIALPQRPCPWPRSSPSSPCSSWSPAAPSAAVRRSVSRPRATARRRRRAPQPSAPSSPQPTADRLKPTDAPADGPFTVDLDNLTDHDVSVVIDDETGILDGAVSGKPGDGMSVRWFDVKVENLDADDAPRRVGRPAARRAAHAVDLRGRRARTASAWSRRRRRRTPMPSAIDRILVLRFDTDVNADDVEVTFEEAAASAG